MSSPSRWTMESIGVFRSDLVEKADAPRQPRAAAGRRGRVELHGGLGLEDAVADLDVWERLWIVFVFDRALSWRPKVLPPRSEVRRGVLGTRAPHRPNPIGLSAVRLERVDVLTIHVRDVDILDGSPVLDIKPYVAWADAHPEAGGGWLTDDPAPSWTVAFMPDAETQLAWLAAHGIDLRQRIEDHLALGPRPHAYRRIKPLGSGYVLSVKEWRVHFTVLEQDVCVTGLACGEAPSKRTELHAAFVTAFGR